MITERKLLQELKEDSAARNFKEDAKLLLKQYQSEKKPTKELEDLIDLMELLPELHMRRFYNHKLRLRKKDYADWQSANQDALNIGIRIGVAWAQFIRKGACKNQKRRHIVWEFIRQHYEQNGRKVLKKESISAGVTWLEAQQKAGTYTGKIPKIENLLRKWNTVFPPSGERGAKGNPPQATRGRMH